MVSLLESKRCTLEVGVFKEEFVVWVDVEAVAGSHLGCTGAGQVDAVLL